MNIWGLQVHYLQKKVSIYNINFTYRHEAITYKSMAVTVLLENAMVGVLFKNKMSYWHLKANFIQRLYSVLYPQW